MTAMNERPPPCYVQIVGDSRVRVWGLTGRRRLLRSLRKFAHATVVSDQDPAPPGAPLLWLRGDCLFDERLLRALAAREDEFILHAPDLDAAVAARTANRDAAVLDGAPHSQALPRLAVADLEIPYGNRMLKFRPPRVWRVEGDNRAFLELELYRGAYKRVTDLVTKWVWPTPARWATRMCVRLGIRPNQVTTFSLVLAALAGVAFWYGEYAAGLLLGWVMTFLDTVDGKLARVTLTSSRLGNALDHGLDLVHPPLWYIAWGVGLAAYGQPLAEPAAWTALMLAAYIGGRLCELTFRRRVGFFSMFLWRPVDSLNRLVTARRNPNLLILSGASLAGRPDAGLMLVVAWHVLSTLFLLARLGVAWRVRRRGPLVSWLAECDAGGRGGRLVRVFA